jgi:hypothetical protein
MFHKITAFAKKEWRAANIQPFTQRWLLPRSPARACSEFPEAEESSMTTDGYRY